MSAEILYSWANDHQASTIHNFLFNNRLAKSFLLYVVGQGLLIKENMIVYLRSPKLFSFIWGSSKPDGICWMRLDDAHDHVDPAYVCGDPSRALSSCSGPSRPYLTAEHEWCTWMFLQEDLHNLEYELPLHVYYSFLRGSFISSLFSPFSFYFL